MFKRGLLLGDDVYVLRPFYGYALSTMIAT